MRKLLAYLFIALAIVNIKPIYCYNDSLSLFILNAKQGDKVPKRFFNKELKGYYTECKKFIDENYQGKKLGFYVYTEKDQFVSRNKKYSVSNIGKYIRPLMDDNMRLEAPSTDEDADYFVYGKTCLFNIQKIVWQKEYFEWDKEKFGGASQVANNGIVVMSIGDTAENRGQYPCIYKVFNKELKLLYYYPYGGVDSELKITADGKYVFIEEEYTTHKLFIYNLSTKDSLTFDLKNGTSIDYTSSKIHFSNSGYNQYALDSLFKHPDTINKLIK